MKKGAHNQTKEKEVRKVKEMLKNKKRNYTSSFGCYNISINNIGYSKY